MLQDPDEEEGEPDPVDPDAVEAHALSSFNPESFLRRARNTVLRLHHYRNRGLKFYNTYSTEERSISKSFVLWHIFFTLPWPGKETEVKKRPKESLR